MSSTSGNRLATVFSALIASVLSVTLFAKTGFCDDFSVGPWQISDSWQLTNLGIGWSPVGGVSVTISTGAFAVPVNDVSSGNWSDPTVRSLSNIVVLYNRAEAWQNFLTGQSGVDYSNGSVSFGWQGLTGGLGPTEQSVTFPTQTLAPIESVNLGTTLQYNVTISNSITLNQSPTLNSLSVLPGGQLSFQPGTSLVLRSGNSQNSGTITGANLTIQSGASLSNSATVTGAVVSIQNGATLNNQGAFGVTGVGGVTYSGSVLTNSGTITQTANSTVIGSSGIATINNLSGATWNLQGDNSQVNEAIVFNNAGLFCKSSGTGTATLFYNYYGSQYGFNNTGTLEVDSGILGIGNGSNSGGNIVVANGAMLQLGLDAGEGCVFTLHGNPSISGSGVVQVPAYAAVRVTNGETATLGTSSPGVSIVVSGGNLYPDAGSTLMLNCVGGSALSLAGGAIGGNGTTTNTGNFLWAGGSITGTGGLTNQSSQFTISSGGINGGSVLTNSGTITQLANSTVMGSGGIAVINNLSGAVWNLQGDNSQIVDYIAFNNAGIFRKSSGTGTANLFYNYTSGSQYGFNNTGTLEVDSGILGIGNGSNSGGSIVVANGAMLQLGLDAGEGCVFTLHGSPSISGSGVVQVPAYAAVRVTNGETATLGTSSPGVSIVVSGGNLYPDAGSTLMLNCVGGQPP